MTDTHRTELLKKAGVVVNGERENTYGGPEDSFARIAKGWSAILDIDVSPIHVATMMAWLKIARLSENPNHEDSWVDLAGYAACGYDVSKTLLDE